MTHKKKEDKKESDENVDKSSKIGTKGARDLAVKAIQALRAKKIKNAGFYISEPSCNEIYNHFVNTSILMNYQYSLKEDVFENDVSEEEKIEKSQKPNLLESMTFYTEDTLSEEQLKETNFYVKSALSCLYGRDLINTRGSIATPDVMEELIREVAGDSSLIKEIHMIKGKELEEQGLNMFYNVGKAAESEPRLMTVHYKGNPDSDTTDFAIVGKGLTYDTGGLDLKPYPYMKTMY